MDSKNQVLPFHLGKLELLVITGEDKAQWYMCLVAGKELSLVGQVLSTPGPSTGPASGYSSWNLGKKLR